MVGAPEGVPTVELPGDGELPGVAGGVEAGLHGGEAPGAVRVGVLDAAPGPTERVGDAYLVGRVEGHGAVERRAAGGTLGGGRGSAGGGGSGGRGGEGGGVGVCEADLLVEHQRRVHELETHVLQHSSNGEGGE